MPFILDASVTMAWCFEDEATHETDSVLGQLAEDEAHVPALWGYEVANVLVGAERRGRITESRSTRFLELLTALPIRIDTGAQDHNLLLGVARTHELSAYDAAYLALAERLGLALATLDGRLGQAASAAGVPLLMEAI